MMSKDPPPPRDTHHFTILVMLGTAEPRWRTLTNFRRHITIVNSGLCKAQDPLGCQLTAYTETLCLLNCWNFCNFTPDDQCTLA